MKKSTGFKGLISLLLVMCLMVSTFGTAYVPTEAAVNKNISIVRIVRYKNSLKVKFKVENTKKISGYQVQASTSKKFKKAKTKSVKVKASKMAAKVKKLKKNTKYFVRVRSYTKKKNGKVKYSKWSKVKSAKTLEKSNKLSNEYNTKGLPLSMFIAKEKELKQLVPGRLGVNSSGIYFLYNTINKKWESLPTAVLYKLDDGSYSYQSMIEQPYAPGVYVDSGYGFDRDEIIGYTKYLKLVYKVYKGLNITDNMTDIQKAMIVSRWMRENVVYAFKEDGVTPDSYYHGGAYNAIIEGRTVCGGYAVLTSHLLRLCNIDSPLTLTISEKFHEVTGIKLFDKWWYLDQTGGGIYIPTEVNVLQNKLMQEKYGEEIYNEVCQTAIDNLKRCNYGLYEIVASDFSSYDVKCLNKIGALNCLGKKDNLKNDKTVNEILNAMVFARDHKIKSRTEILKS